MLSYNNTLVSENCKTSDKSIPHSGIGTLSGETPRDNTRDNNSRVRSLNTELTEQIQNIRTHYAKTNTKGVFLSKKYKIDCAKTVLSEIDITTLLESCIVSIPNTYQLYFDYTIFKSFIIPELYDTIINYTVNKISYCIHQYEKIELHINLNTFSISAYNRYKDCIIAYTQKLYSTIPNFPTILVAMHLYNTPSSLDTISQLLGTLLPEETRRKVIKHDNKSSEKAINTILEIVHITDLSNSILMCNNTLCSTNPSSST